YAAQKLCSSGVGTVLASLGADGALLVDDRGVFHGRRSVVPRSTVGAGDATLAGYLAAEQDDPVTGLRHAVGFGCAAVELPGTQMPGPRDVRVDLVDVTQRPELGLVLARTAQPEAAPE
ncbi:MAG: 1-phosphofructokinase, partial [Nitriliruptorales bacterium]|nr:1-phosphofructokinase [Nitriliruptorales bacterium]